MRAVKLTLQYDGTEYVGWQRQASGTSIQGLVEEAVAGIIGQPVTVIGAGRTDAGVHALGQVASARFEHHLELPALARALNARLPDDIRIIAAEEAATDFHARFEARAKTYCYRIMTGDVASPFERRYSWYLPFKLDVAAMAEAARPLEGEHDFAGFQSAGGDTGRSVRTISEVILLQSSRERAWHDPGLGVRSLARGRMLIHLQLTSDGFLRHMVRAIVGTLVEVGAGRRSPASVKDVLASRDRSRAGPTAPPQGLFLVRVSYEGNRRGAGATA